MRSISPLAILIFAIAATQPALSQPGCTGAGPIVCTATGESTAAGMVVSGSYVDTTTPDGFELIEEHDAAVGPPPKRTDLLEHTWQFSVAAGASFKFTATAYRIDAGGDGDDFAFSYSRDGGQTWSGMFTVAGDSPAGYEYNMPGNAAGPLLVRAVDIGRTGGRNNHAGLYVAYLAVIVSSDPPPPPNPEPGVSAKRIIGYYTSWSVYVRDYFVNEHEPGVDHIPAGKVTHINYAFANLLPDGTVVVGDEFADVNKIFGNEPPNAPYKGNFQQLNILKSRRPHIKTLISVGGWTWSDHFSDVFAVQSTREHFCDSLLGFVQQYGFDGADIDWEFPGDPGEGDNSFRPGLDAANFVSGLQYCRPLFDAADKLLTVATPCDPRLFGEELDLAAMMPYLDWVNLLSYDLHGAWDPFTGHQSQLYQHASPPIPQFSQSACVQGHIASGVAPEDITLGVPVYGRGYANVAGGAGGNPAVPGLFQSFSGVPKGTWDGGKWGVTGIYDYEDIVLNILPGGNRTFDGTAKVPSIVWSLGRKQGNGFMSYDDVESVCEKANYADGAGLGGLMFWEFSGDIENHPRSLVNAMYCGLNPSFEGCAEVCEE